MSDISRADAIEAVLTYFIPRSHTGERGEHEEDFVRKIFNALPSAEPKTKYVVRIEVDIEEIVRRIKEEYDITSDWIPCSERLPDNKTYVLTTIQVNGRQPHARSGFYHDGFFHNDNGDTWEATDREVRAWMPSPKPYREDGENDGED